MYMCLSCASKQEEEEGIFKARSNEAFCLLYNNLRILQAVAQQLGTGLLALSLYTAATTFIITSHELSPFKLHHPRVNNRVVVKKKKRFLTSSRRVYTKRPHLTRVQGTISLDKSDSHPHP